MKKRFSEVHRETLLRDSQECLWSSYGEHGLFYLRKQRGLSDEVIRSFGLGYIPVEYKHQLAGRIIIPLFDPSNNLIVLSSRLVKAGDNQLPNYWHESYKKSFYLYGVPQSIKLMRQWRFTIICVDGEEEIFNPTTGNFSLVKELSVGDHVLSFNESTYRNSQGQISRIIPSGMKKCLKLRHSNGSIVLTPEHKVFVNGQWRKASEAKKGDLLLTPMSYSLDDHTIECPLSLDECRLLGYMIGDGCCKGSPEFSNTDQNIIADFKNIVAKTGDRVSQRDNRHFTIYGSRPRGGYKQVINRASSKIQDMLKMCKIYGRLSYEKTIPSFIFQSPNKYVIELLNGLFDTDGTVSNQGNQVSYSTTSEVLAKQIKMLLLRFGILSNCHKILYKNPKHRTGYIVSITGGSAVELSKYLTLQSRKKADRLERFKPTLKCDYKYPVVDYIRTVCKEKKMTKKDLLRLSGVSLTTLNRKYISYRHIENINIVLKDKLLSILLKENVIASKIEEIEDVGTKEVYDLTVPGYNNFYLGHCLTHNCEGQFDVLQLHTHGIGNCVGLCANKMSTTQLSVIERYCDEIVLILDTDDNRAGQEATLNILKQFANSKMTAVHLPQGDPDEFVRKNGGNALRRLIKDKLSEMRSKYE